MSEPTPFSEQPTATFPALDADVPLRDPVLAPASSEQTQAAFDAAPMPQPLVPNLDASSPTESVTTWLSAGPVAAPVPAPAQPVLAGPDPRDGQAAVTCPECGSVQEVVLNRRESTDFCRSCDYPLFWTPSLVLRDFGDGSDESLRRMPGTVGRATLAALPCPHCAEPNTFNAATCVRCGRPMQLEAPPPPPPPVVHAPPPPPPVEEPDRGVPWWAWAAVALSLVAIVTVGVLAATHHL